MSLLLKFMKDLKLIHTFKRHKMSLKHEDEVVGVGYMKLDKGKKVI